MSAMLRVEFITERISFKLFKERLQAKAHGIGVILHSHGMEYTRRRFSIANDVSGIEQYIMLRIAGQFVGILHAEVNHIDAHSSRPAGRGRSARRLRAQMLQGNNGAGGNYADGTVQIRPTHSQRNGTAAAQGKTGDVIILPVGRNPREEGMK